MIDTQLAAQQSTTGWSGIPEWAQKMAVANTPTQTVADLMVKVNTLTTLVNDMGTLLAQMAMREPQPIQQPKETKNEDANDQQRGNDQTGLRKRGRPRGR